MGILSRLRTLNSRLEKAVENADRLESGLNRVDDSAPGFSAPGIVPALFGDPANPSGRIARRPGSSERINEQTRRLEDARALREDLRRESGGVLTREDLARIQDAAGSVLLGDRGSAGGGAGGVGTKQIVSKLSDLEQAIADSVVATNQNTGQVSSGTGTLANELRFLGDRIVAAVGGRGGAFDGSRQRRRERT